MKKCNSDSVSSSRSWVEIRRASGVGLTFLCLWFLSSCTTLGPEFKRPDAQISTKWSESENQILTGVSDESSQWWHVFNDPVLNRLIDLAAQQNLTLQTAGLKILEARAELGIAIGQQYPQSQQLSGEYSLSKSSKNTPPHSGFSGLDRDSSIADFGFSAAWELDFWGKFRRSIEVADAQLAASLADYDDILVILTAEVASTYMVIQTIKQRIDFANSNVTIQERALEITHAQFEGGTVTDLDVQQARSLLLNTKALIPELEISLRQAKNSLSILLGLPAEDLAQYLDDESTLPHVPATVAVGIPADLLRRRPDIRYAEFQVASQGAMIGVAQADLYPQFALAGSIGFAADNKTLIGSDSLTGFFTPFTFKWDIFNYGRIKNNVRAQDARFQQAVINYRNQVLEAVKEVEDGLIGFLKSQIREKLLEDAQQASLRATELSLLHYKDGLADYTRVLNSQQVLVAQQDSFVKAKGDVINYLIATYKALGGGWQIKAGKNLIPEDMVRTMKSRTDWGDLLESVSHP